MEAIKPPADPEQRLDITCAHCGKRIDFRRGEVYTNGVSYVCAVHASSAPAAELEGINPTNEED
jgi:hypothetical protein